MIPDQLVGTERFIEIEPESKAPRFSPEGPFFAANDSELQEWIENGGNVGLNLGELVALDVDSGLFRGLANEHLLPTFSVRSGSGGEHWYYRSEWSGRSQFSSGETDFGSLRSGNWYVVVPPSIHPNGEPYQVLRDRPIQKVPAAQIHDFIEAVEEKTDSQHSGRAGPDRGGGGCVGGSPVPSIPEKYPEKPATWETAKNWLSANGLLKSLNRTSSSDWSGLEFKIAKCLAEGGFSESVISDALDRLSHESKWHRRSDQQDDYQDRTVRNAIVTACNDDYVDFSNPGDMDALASESRKTESGGKDTGLRGGDNMSATYTDKEEVTILEGSEDGDNFKKVVRTVREENGESVEYVSIKKGRVEEVELKSGESGLTERVTDSTSIGSPEYIEELAEALEELSDKIDN
jgi:hypothetical protein